MAEHGPPARLPVFVVGTRAQLIKVAPVIVACERRGLPVRLVMTGQHQETMQDLIEEFGVAADPIAAIPPEERATVGSLLRWLPAAHGGLRRTLSALRNVAPLDVLVHGDTLSTLLGAWIGRRDRVLHLESGLTSGRLLDPFPEEIARRLVFRLSDVAFCPGPVEAAVMRRFPAVDIVETGGNTIVDAVRLSGAAARAAQPHGDYVVASLHRFQNLYNETRLRHLVDVVTSIAASRPVHFVLHPATRKRLAALDLIGTLQASPGVNLSPRLGYGEFMRLAAGAACVLTDGGSNQEELAALGIPTLVMRERTERSDGLGRNARMESEVPDGVVAFMASRGFDALRSPQALDDVASPSEAIADFLSRPVP